jgi:hypothetical protein
MCEASLVPLNIKDEEVERLAAEIAALTGERFLEQEVWPTVPEGVLGKAVSREEEDAILGYGDKGF